MADAPNWGWIGGFTYPIVFDEFYLTATDMTWDQDNLAGYMFHGARWPGDPIGENPGQAMWYAAVCLAGTPPCLPADGSNIHIGSITFSIDNWPPYQGTVIDTGMYPPSNYATMGDETGTRTIWPEWTPLILYPHPCNTGEEASSHHFSLNVAGPNPFKAFTTINYGVEKKAEVDISVYDITGRLVKTLVDDVKGEGAYPIQWDGTDNSGRRVASGTYSLRMKTDSYNSIKSLILLY